MIGIRIRVLQFNGDEASVQESLAQSAVGFKCTEGGSELLLKADGRFECILAYGALGFGTHKIA